MALYIDMRDVTLNPVGASGVFNSQRKAEAVAFAKAHGWYTGDVSRATNRFFVFWVVGQMVGENYVVLNKDGTRTEFPWQGHIKPGTV